MMRAASRGARESAASSGGDHIRVEEDADLAAEHVQQN
jgi:hypothetical protein